MKRILFVCHGNICRSPMAEYVMKDLVAREGLSNHFEIASAATTYEEIGNPVYPPVRKLLSQNGISCAEKRARRITHGDYEYYDLLIGMDKENREDMLYFFSGDPKGKVKNLLDYAGKIGAPISDPWYTRNFQKTWDDVMSGCSSLLSQLKDSSDL